MKITQADYEGRKAIQIQNDRIRASALLGGGHIAELRLHESEVNPMWKPLWNTCEPGEKTADQLVRSHGPKAEAPLLASIAGHNVCLGNFGPPSPAEAAHGMRVHGETGVTNWTLTGEEADEQSAAATYGCTLPEAGMDYSRRLEVRKGENILYFEDCVRNLQKVDKPFTWTQHWTVGQPFVQHGVTLFDCSGTKCKAFPVTFAPVQRLKKNEEYRWPNAPGSHGGTVNMRVYPEKPGSGDFTTVLMDQRAEYAWATAANPQQGVLIGYVWPRLAYPWLGIWEENMVRTHKPWSKKEVTRGLEFGNTPFPLPKRDSVEMAKLFGVPTYQWLDGGGEIRVCFLAFIIPIEPNFTGVKSIEMKAGALVVRERGKDRTHRLRRTGLI
ncbi:MAG TPA: hypothetical protein PL033_07710 [Candidatus Brocadiia bacterium]|nr:hypothetical protein [Candidatus Brocadiia bacterium]